MRAIFTLLLEVVLVWSVLASCMFRTDELFGYGTPAHCLVL